MILIVLIVQILRMQLFDKTLHGLSGIKFKQINPPWMLVDCTNSICECGHGISTANNRWTRQSFEDQNGWHHPNQRSSQRCTIGQWAPVPVVSTVSYCSRMPARLCSAHQSLVDNNPPTSLCFPRQFWNNCILPLSRVPDSWKTYKLVIGNSTKITIEYENLEHTSIRRWLMYW